MSRPANHPFPPLLRQRDFTLLWTASVVSLLGTWTLRVALPVSVLRSTGQPGDVAAVSAAALLGATAVGWAAGGWVDRWDRRRVLIGGNALQTLIILTLAADPRPTTALVAAVAAAESATAQFLQPAENALLPSLVVPDQAVAANSWLAVGTNAARLLGPALGGVVATTAGLRGAAALDAATFAVAAGLSAAISGRHRAARREAPDTGILREIRAGWAAFRHHRTARAILLLLAVSGFGDGAMGTLQPVLATRVLHGDARLLGVMTSAQAVGGILGGLAAARWAARVPAVPLIAGCFTWFGLADLGLGLYPRWSDAAWPAVGLFGLAGLAVGVHVGVIWALFQSTTEDGIRGRMFAGVWAAASLTAAAGALTAGATAGELPAGRLPAVNVLLLPGAFALLAAAVFARTAGAQQRTGRTGRTE